MELVRLPVLRIRKELKPPCCCCLPLCAEQDIAGEFGVRGIPAFHFYKGGQKVEEVVGADQAKLRALVEKLYVASSFQGQGRILGKLDLLEALCCCVLLVQYKGLVRAQQSEP